METSGKQWFCLIGDRQYGPVELDTLRAWLREGRLGPGDYVWGEGMPQWAPVSSIPELRGTQPPPPPKTACVALPPPGGTDGQTPNGQINREALGLLGGRWGLAIGFVVLLLVVELAFSVVPYVGGLASLILSGPVELGASIFFLTLARGGEGEFGMLFAGFRNFGNALGTYLLRAVFVWLWTLAAALPGGIIGLVLGVAAGGDVRIAVAVMAGAIPGVIAGTIAQLGYSQAMYLVAEDSTLGPMEALRRSRQMMMGRKGKLFGLYVRYFGWSLLCIFTLGIGFLFLWPYVQTGLARFHDDLYPPASTAPAPTEDRSPAAGRPPSDG